MNQTKNIKNVFAYYRQILQVGGRPLPYHLLLSKIMKDKTYDLLIRQTPPDVDPNCIPNPTWIKMSLPTTTAGVIQIPTPFITIRIPKKCRTYFNRKFQQKITEEITEMFKALLILLDDETTTAGVSLSIKTPAPLSKIVSFSYSP
jgi:hypothetical protein